MARHSQLELRVSRLENDRDSMYEIIAEILSTQQEHSLRFDGMDRRFDGVDSALAEIVRRLPEPS